MDLNLDCLYLTYLTDDNKQAYFDIMPQTKIACFDCFDTVNSKQAVSLVTGRTVSSRDDGTRGSTDVL